MSECEHGSLKRSCQICELEEEIKRLRERVEELEDENTQLKQGYTAIRNDMSRLSKAVEKKISGLMAEIAGRDEAIEAMERRIKAEESQHGGCKRALTKALGELSDNNELFETMDKQMNRLCDDNVRLDDEYDELEKRFTSAASYAEELELGTEELNNQIEELNNRIISIWEEHGYKITNDQIKAAVAVLDGLKQLPPWDGLQVAISSLEKALAELGIKRCEGCGGKGHFGNNSVPCPTCNGNGFVVENK